MRTLVCTRPLATHHRSREVRSSDASYDEFVAAQLWAESAKLVDQQRRLGTLRVSTFVSAALALALPPLKVRCRRGPAREGDAAVGARTNTAEYRLVLYARALLGCASAAHRVAGLVAAAVAVAAVFVSLLVFRLL